MSISVFGAGAFGTALAIALAETGPVTLWSRNAQEAARLQSERRNQARLPGAAFPDTLSVTGDITGIGPDSAALLAVPMQALRGFLADHRSALAGRRLVACCKGAELDTGLGPAGVIRSVLPRALPSVLTGPSFAADIAAGLPTALTLGNTDDSIALSLQQALSAGSLRIYRTTDVTGAELGGALKNVIAIGCGAVMGAGLGESARAALMTRGYAEMVRYAVSLGARPETLAGLSGLGDLSLTCNSPQSRNFRRGLALGRGERFDASTTVEGAATARAIHARAVETGVDMPVTAAVVSLLQERQSVSEVVADMFARPLKQE